MSVRPKPESVFRIAVDLASSRAHQIDFLLRVVEAKSEERALRFLRSSSDQAELVIRDVAVATETGDRRRLVVARGQNAPATTCPTPVAVVEPLNLHTITDALQRAVESAATSIESSPPATDRAAERAHQVLDRWLQRRTPVADLHLVGADGRVVLALLADGRSRLGAAYGSIAAALDAPSEFLVDGATLSAAAWPDEPRERPLSQTLWDIAQRAGAGQWVGDLGPDATIELRFWPFQAADAPPTASRVLRRLRKGAASVAELLSFGASERDDVVRLLNACLAIEAIRIVRSTAPAPTAVAAEPIPVVVLGEAPSRLSRMLTSIRRVLAIG